MKKSISISMLFAALLTACAPAIKVTMDYDKQANFSQFKTYTFAPEALTLPVNDLNRRRILTAVEEQLTTKGLTKAENGDLIVDIRISAKERKEATANTTGGGGYYGYRYGGGYQTTSVTVQTYVDGTLIISLVDAAKKELIWQGTGVKTLDESATAEQREQNLNEAVKAIFANYPPGAKKAAY